MRYLGRVYRIHRSHKKYCPPPTTLSKTVVLAPSFFKFQKSPCSPLPPGPKNSCPYFSIWKRSQHPLNYKEYMDFCRVLSQKSPYIPFQRPSKSLWSLFKNQIKVLVPFFRSQKKYLNAPSTKNSVCPHLSKSRPGYPMNFAPSLTEI